MAGLKMRNSGAICPLTNTPLISEDNLSHQSRDINFPLHLNLGKETKAKFDGEFRQLFEFFGDIHENGFDGSLPFYMACKVNLSAAWKGLMRGGGAKVHAHPCHCCAIHSDDLHHPNTERCDRFCTERGEDKRCYHKSIITDTRIEQMKEEVDHLVQRLNQQVEQGVVEGSELTNEDPCNRDGRENARNDPSSIHFEPKSHRERIDFSCLINNELQLCQLPCKGRLLEITERLREYLKS
jgi:hypothetical protein